MNIHINREHYEELYEDTIDSFTIGSELYDLQTPDSDRDMLLVYHSWNQSFINSNTMYQYKDTGLDVILLTPQQFVQNLISGDSTILAELLCSEEFLGSEFGRIFVPYREDLLMTSKVLTAFVGRGKLDSKNWNKSGDLKALQHFVRNMDYLKSLRKTKTIDFEDLAQGIKDKVQEIKGQKLLNQFVKDMRVQIDKGYPIYPDARVLQDLDNDLLDYLETEDSRHTFEKYNAFVNGFVTYDSSED